MKTVGALHDRLVVNRRMHVLVAWFAQLVPKNARLLDVGSGDGAVSALLQEERPDLSIRGLDVLPRDHPQIQVELFNGSEIPYADNSFDAVLFSDVLHHTQNPTDLLREGERVTARHLLLKDHFRKGPAAQLRLRFMDWVGNARFGVSLPYNYWTEEQWTSAWREVGLRPLRLEKRLGLYPQPADWVFGAGLHFIALLEKIGVKADGKNGGV